MKYRSRIDIAALILEAANGGAAKTKIMYKAFLSYAQLKEYLNKLIENGLIEHNKEERIFRITEKGLRFLQLYNQADELISTKDWDYSTNIIMKRYYNIKLFFDEFLSQLMDISAATLEAVLNFKSMSTGCI